jgi:hypothetical protein
MYCVCSSVQLTRAEKTDLCLSCAHPHGLQIHDTRRCGSLGRLLVARIGCRDQLQHIPAFSHNDISKHGFILSSSVSQ